MNNVHKGWNNAFSSLLGHTHLSFWIVLDALQTDEALVTADRLRYAWSAAQKKVQEIGHIAPGETAPAVPGAPR